MSSSEDEDVHAVSSEEEEEEEFSRPKSHGTKKRAKKTIEQTGGDVVCVCSPCGPPQRYQKKSQLDHILLRPDSYIGSTEKSIQQLWVMPDGAVRMQLKNISFAPGLYKIVDEILVNAADVKARETEGREAPPRGKMTAIKVNVDPAEGMIRVWNDGEGIPVAIHKEHQVYVAELIFGQLLTSDNYDDTEARVTGGRNGFGAKLTNIFSSYFEVECADSKRKQKIKVVWTDNMGKQQAPVLTPFNGAGDFVAVKFKPDLGRFGMSTLDEDLISLLRKRCYDLAGTSGTAVYWNGVRLPVRSFVDYVDLYLGSCGSRKKGNRGKEAAGRGKKRKRKKKKGSGESSESSEGSDSEAEDAAETQADEDKENERTPEKQVIKIHEKMHRWEVVISQSDGSGFQQVSFVNSICTPKGGHHVNHVIEPLLAALVKKANAKNKGGMEIKPPHVRQHLWVFVKCLIENPAFDSQTKETLTTTVSRFGSKCNLSERTVNAVAKSAILDGVLLWAQTKAQVELRRQMSVGKTKGKERLTGISKLEDANEAGGRYAQACTLILTEGDSAKTSCLAGLSVVGREKYGVFPLRGKLLNVREASFKQLKENREIQNILRILGLQINDKVQDTRGLRYGSLMIMTDQDYDGSHIKGLLINMLHHYWPHLLQCNHFLTEFVTPIVKVSKGSVEKAFFTLVEYDMWRKQAGNLSGWKIKYYKASSLTTLRFVESFVYLLTHIGSDPARGSSQVCWVLHAGAFLCLPLPKCKEKHHLWSASVNVCCLALTFVLLPLRSNDGELIDMAFSKKRAEDRKRWLQGYREGTFVDHSVRELTFSDFVNKELVQFSRYDNERSIPQLVDGWKVGQRKVLFAVFKKNTKAELKVAQLSGYVAEQSAYHHGEQSLQQTIITMAQRFVGSNNLNFLEPVGQFGSRKEGGKDASAPRYIFTKLAPYTRLVFPEADDPLLEYLYEEGQKIEPKYYVPVIPTVLVNGSEGIGTGWSSFIPNFNPRDIIANLKRFIAGEEMVRMKPWYRGFKGVIEESPTKIAFETVGLVERKGEDVIEITELPIKRWTQSYLDICFLCTLMVGPLVSPFRRETANPSWGKKRLSLHSTPPRMRSPPQQDYKEWLEEQLPAPEKKEPLISDYRDSSSHEDIKFAVKVSPERLASTDDEGLLKLFRLKSSLSTQNYHLFNAEGRVQKYADELEIMRDFATIRLAYYEQQWKQCSQRVHASAEPPQKRKAYLVAVSEKEKAILYNRSRFISAVLSGELIGYDPMRELEKKCAALIDSILNHKIPQEHGLSDKESADEEPATACGCVGSDFDYLVGMPLWSLTAEKVADLKRQLRDKEIDLEGLRQTDIRALWLKDLDALLEAIEKQDAADLKQREADQAFHRQLESKKGLKGFAALKGKPKAAKEASAAAPKVGSAKSASKTRTKKVHSSSEEESISSSDASEESPDELSLDDDSSDEDRPLKVRARPPQTQQKTNGVQPDEPPKAACSKVSPLREGAIQGEKPSLAPPLFGTSALSEKKESVQEIQAAPPPIQSLSLLDRLRLGGGCSFSSSAPIRTKQLTLDEIFAPTASSSSKPSEAGKPIQTSTVKASETCDHNVAPTNSMAIGTASVEADTLNSGILKTPPKPKRRRILADSSDSDGATKSTSKPKQATPRKSASTTPQKRPQTTPKKHKPQRDDEDSDSARGEDSHIGESPIASNRPRRAAAQAPKKYTVASSESSNGESDESEEASEAESISEDDE
ncbi:DNA topoisomerase [Cyclospora cayetanensis]|uniref:DNA topoisomerase 2 n=1 Tax=Cyclospora cayetanensis TaxID=88456 RepID=A0A1D3D569_9EIME|nr:DNA topoisomerase [Cyclospora cayetanensis]